MGFKDNDRNEQLYKQYIEFTQKSVAHYPNELQSIADEVFERLIAEKKAKKSKNKNID